MRTVARVADKKKKRLDVYDVRVEDERSELPMSGFGYLGNGKVLLGEQMDIATGTACVRDLGGV